MTCPKSLWLMTGVLFAAAVPAPVSAMTIEQAYAAIPHKRPVFEFAIARLSPDEAPYLKELFTVIDLAVKERVETLAWLQSRGSQGENFDQYDEIIWRLQSLQVPQRLQPVHQLVTEAIQDQRDVLRSWRASPQAVSMSHPLVQGSSQKLHQAYGDVIRLYRTDHPKNQEAFYNYFCCLDFL